MNKTTRARKGFSILYFVIISSVMFGVASLALDAGRVQLAKTELRIVTDSIARHASQWVSGGASTVLIHANEVAGDNKVAGMTVKLDSSALEVGSWDSSKRSFTANGTPQNAMRLTTSVMVPLTLGAPIGMESCRISASAVVKCVPQGIVGVGDITFKNNSFIGSYNSSTTTTPTQATANSNASLSTNGSVTGKHNGTIEGDVYLGPSGSLGSGVSVSGSTSTLATDVPVPADPAWNPVGNPGGVPQNYTNTTKNAVLAGGTYWFTSFSSTKALSFSGPATLYVKGNIDLDGNLTAYKSIPENLTIYQIGTGRTFTMGGDVTAKIIAPGSDFSTKNNFDLYGMAIFNTITVKNNGAFFCDEAIGDVAALALVE